jgi:hypothetical protein
LELLQAMLQVDSNTYKAAFKGWENIRGKSVSVRLRTELNRPESLILEILLSQLPRH